MVMGLFILVYLSGTFMNTVSARQASRLTDGLVAYYSFDDGNANDGSANGNNGQLFDTVSVAGVKGKALRFNGTSSYAIVAHSPSLNLKNAFTISVWVNVQAPASDGYTPILTKGNATTLATPYAIVYHSVSGSNQIPHLRFTGNNGQNYVDDLPVANGLPLKTWTLCTWRYQDGLVEVFSDGIKIGEQNIHLSELDESMLPLEIGRDIPGVTEFLDGSLDEVRIYNRAITDSEIYEIYQQERPYTVHLPLIKR